ncbi:hypothetical protein AZ34_15925 [Hylemonella gracilis str. Niagara R]|uniref:Uncharacterized protein n=1 Tax=Hylemonella gracilis str. Niagara R TaxID=1458275 RepID=A0A016XLK3_9BURK|nr:hypothetical protein [Hylemonella gracilis]EYC52974.1 hypothetical protein AZ34_15925 [Hylemonella gracilis str. Niagara R]
MTFAFHPLRLFCLPCARLAPARPLAVGLAAVVLSQLAGCAAQLWPPSGWSLSVDLPFVNQQPITHTAVNTNAPPVSADPQELGTAVEALDYAVALCSLTPEALGAEIERLKAMAAQNGQTALRAQQLAFAQLLAALHAQQQDLQASNAQQAQLLREHQKRIEQLNGQIAAMRAVEDSLPLASPVPSSRITTGPVPVVPAPQHSTPNQAGPSP